MSERRDTGVDAVRGVALISMYVAHCAPSDGPGNVLLLTEYLTYPLFALLVGVGAQLSARSAGTTASPWWLGALVRGAVLIVVAEGLERAGAQIYIVLAFLGVLTWVAWPVARCPTWAVGAIGGAALALAPLLSNQDSAWLLPLIEDGRLTEARLLSFLAVGGSYQLMSMVFFAAVGIVVTRLMTDGPLAGDRARLAAGWAVAAGWVGCLALDDLGLVDLQPYDITYPVVVFDALMAVGCLLVVPVVAGWARLASPLAMIGSMSLTLYSLQILWLAYDTRVWHDGMSDNSWTNVAILTLGSFAMAAAWRGLVRREPWQRGPLEGATAALIRVTSTPIRQRPAPVDDPLDR